MGSPTVLHFQWSVGNKVLPLIPCTVLRISANASPYGCMGFVINSTLNILSARGLAHSERQRNVKNVTLRSAELHNTERAIYFPTSKITFIKHPKKQFFCPVANRSFSARSARRTGCSLRGPSSRQRLCGVGSRSTRRPHQALPGALAWPVVPAAPLALQGHDMVAEARHLPPGKYRGERRMQKDAEGGCAGAGQEQLQHFTLTNEFMYHRFYWKEPDPIRIPTVFPMC